MKFLQHNFCFYPFHDRILAEDGLGSSIGQSDIDSDLLSRNDQARCLIAWYRTVQALAVVIVHEYISN